MYVLAHNGDFKGKTCAELFILDNKTKRLLAIKEIGTKCAHNFILFKNHTYCCNSPKGELLLDTTPFFVDADYFIRGLSITDSTIVVGGSQFAERSRRLTTDGRLWFLDHTGLLKATVLLEKIGQIYEIRTLGTDYGLSQHHDDTEV